MTTRDGTRRAAPSAVAARRAARARSSQRLAASRRRRQGHRDEGQGAGLERSPEGQAAEAAGSGPAERPAPDGARGSSSAADLTFRSSFRAPAATTIPPAQIGLASYTAQLMREGTKTRSSQQISQELERMAAIVTVGTRCLGRHGDGVGGGALTENFDRAVRLAADVLLNPSFPADEWDRLKTRHEAGLIQQQRSQPGFLAAEMFNRVVYGSHPAGRVSPRRNRIDAITREAMVQFHQTHYVPDHAAIAFAGDITLRRSAQARGGEARRLEEGGGAPKPTVTESAGIGAPQSLSRRAAGIGADDTGRGHAVDDANGSRLRAADGRQPRARRRDGPAVQAPARGEGLHLRHRQRLLGDALFAATGPRQTSVRTEVTEPALTDLLAEIARDARQAGAGRRARRMPNAPSSPASRFRSRARSACSATTSRAGLYGLPADYWDTYPARISAVTAAQAQAAAQEVLGCRRACRSSRSATRRRSPRFYARRASSRSSTRTAIQRSRLGLSDSATGQQLTGRRRHSAPFFTISSIAAANVSTLFERRVDVRRDAHAFVLRVHDRRGDDPPAAPTAARRPSASARR